MADRVRCPWCEGSPIYEKYHDEEWGTACRTGEDTHSSVKIVPFKRDYLLMQHVQRYVVHLPMMQ